MASQMASQIAPKIVRPPFDDDESEPVSRKSYRMSQANDIFSLYSISKVLEQTEVVERYLGTDASQNEVVIIKVYYDNTNGIPAKLLKQIAQHKMISNTTHPNIIKIHSIVPIYDSNILYYITDYCPIQLSSVIRSTCLPITKKEIYREIVSGVEICHRHQIIHGNLTPDNILLSKTGTVQIANIHSAIPKNRGNEMQFSLANSAYFAPEIFLNNPIDLQIDIWAIGCIFAEFLCKVPIFQPSSHDGSLLEQMIIIMKIITIPDRASLFANTQLLQFPGTSCGEGLEKLFLKYCSDCVFDPDEMYLLNECLRFDPQDRPSTQTLLSYPYLQIAGNW
jgi:serine/threonine protein kinase